MEKQPAPNLKKAQERLIGQLKGKWTGERNAKANMLRDLRAGRIKYYIPADVKADMQRYYLPFREMLAEKLKGAKEGQTVRLLEIGPGKKAYYLKELAKSQKRLDAHSVSPENINPPGDNHVPQLKHHLTTAEGFDQNTLGEFDIIYSGQASPFLSPYPNETATKLGRALGVGGIAFLEVPRRKLDLGAVSKNLGGAFSAVLKGDGENVWLIITRNKLR